MIANLLCAIIRLLCGATARRLADSDEGDGVAVYFANHASHLDFLLVWAALPPERRRRVRPVAASDYWRRNRLRTFLAEKVFHAVLIDRHRVSTSRNPLQAMLAALAAGDSLVIFPEGTRSADGTIGRFRSGLHHLHRRAPQARLIPVYLDNLTRILPKGEYLAVPLLSSVTFGPALEPVAGESKEEFLARAQRALQEHQP